MDRRRFLKTIAGGAAAFILPGLIVPERRVFALDQTMMRRPVTQDQSFFPDQDDTAYIQGIIDAQLARGQSELRLPPGSFHIRRTLRLNGAGPFSFEESGTGLITPWKKNWPAYINSEGVPPRIFLVGERNGDRVSTELII